MDSLLTNATPAAKAITLKQSDLFSAAATLPTSQEFFHDLSTSAVGLLTNVATGGWKKDLSLFTGGLLAVAGGATNPGTSNLPLFRFKPGQDILYTIYGNSDATPLIAANSVIGDYAVNLNFRAPGDARLNPLCETKWQYDAGTRTVLFVINQQGARIPRVLGFPDYRAEEKADTP